MALVLVVVLGPAIFLLMQKPPQEKPVPVPSISAGCDRVLWNDTQLELAAVTKNIDKPSFNWTVDGKNVSTGKALKQKLGLGEHKIILTVAFDNKTLTAKQTTIMIDSVENVLLRDSAASKNQWGFQTVYGSKDFGVNGVMISVDSSPSSEVNACGFLSTRHLFAGEHTWRAEYRGHIIASGTFTIKEVNDMKIQRVDIAPSYTAGKTVNGKIILENTGSVSVTGFDIKTLVVNNNFAWMGDKAKREYFDKYTSNLEPGGIYEVPITVVIPEKVSGIRPSGKYTITINLILRNRIVDTKVVNTEIK